MRKFVFILIIISCAIINVAAQVAATLKSDAISGNWSDPIWEINYNGNSYENLIDLPTNILNGQIQLYFENSAQLNMEAFSGNPPFKNIIYNQIMFVNNDGRTINGTSKIKTERSFSTASATPPAPAAPARRPGQRAGPPPGPPGGYFRGCPPPPAGSRWTAPGCSWRPGRS